MSKGVKTVEIQRAEGEKLEWLADAVSVEEPLEIRILQGESVHPVSVTMRTPGRDAELAIGFLFSEGILQRANEVEQIQHLDSNIIVVKIKTDVALNLESLSRNFYTTSSCGVCGKSSLDAVRVRAKRNESNFNVSKSILLKLPAIARQAQAEFETTGGIHASTLFEGTGNFLLLREDVGRHNALDKIIGVLFQQEKLPASETVLLVSGRASFELVQKAAVAGIPVMAAIGAPSSLAVDLAKESGICLIGFLKTERFNIYSHSYRIS